MDAYNRRMEVGGGPKLEATVIREGRWKTCGKRVDTSPAMPALDDEDAWRDRYIGGTLGRYIIGGPIDAPPDVEDSPPSEPERERRDAEHALIDGSMPPPLRPLPALPDPPPDDDPELDTYGGIAGVPAWGQGGAA